ncbi:2-keto-4-pentenoate hydratase [Rhodococcus kronopolitis]|uniref:2-keto-4-pentenoate hydratase n=1 Tax=Rhodococcus kronopolitis TaxID=1460226 RepID=A0ABV9FRS9_9NOCA
MLSTDLRVVIAERLRLAEAGRGPIAPLSVQYPDLDENDAYEIQLLNVGRRLDAGGKLFGHKVGLTSLAMQEMVGLDEPDYGHLFADMASAEEVPVDVTRFCSPKVEVEVGFILGADLPGAECTLEDVLAATEYVVPSIELIDSRIADWMINGCDTIADNASCGSFMLGAARVAPADIDLTAIDTVFSRNGTEVAWGRSDAVLGNPANAVAWIARKMEAYGVRLKAGDFVLPGACSRAVDASAGDYFHADFSGLGTVSMQFK